MHHLGEQIDIHGGGNDLIFPHHENEIAQTESLTGKPFARYWIHNGMMQLSGEKMSKSLGNLVTIEDFLQKHEADLLRMAVLNSGYRHPLTYSEEVLVQAERALERLRQALRPIEHPENRDGNEAERSLREQIHKTAQGFEESMDDDFNTAGSMGYLFDLVRAINQAIDSQVNVEVIQEAQDLLRERMTILGLRPERSQVAAEQTAAFVDLLVQIRKDLRDQRLWALSDKIRDELMRLGVILEDSKSGTKWRWK
jgi:cysteinyl-tRNA synthetase